MPPPTPEQLRERAKEWIAPISEATPAGAAATVDPRYEFVRNEAAKLDSPSAGAVQWKSVVEQGGEILKEKSKDYLMAVYVAFGMYSTQGIEGLTTGVVMLSELTENYWPTMFPELKRIRGRVNALQWFMERMNIALPPIQVKASDRAALEALLAASKAFSAVARAKFEGNCPAMSPLVENVERLVMSLPAEAAPPPPPPPPPPPAAAGAPPSPAPVVQAAPVQQAAPAPVAMPSVAEPAGAEGVANYLRESGTALARAGATLRRSDNSDPAAYRMVRIGIWLGMANLPPAQGSKSSVPAPQAAFRTQLEKMSANQKWAEILDECESALMTNRFWLDLHRYSFQALAGMGGAHKRAKEAIAIEVGSFLRRMPGVLDLTFVDGSPFADAQTKLWIESDVQVGGGDGAKKSNGGGAADPNAEADAAALAEAKSLIGGGKASDAIAVLQVRVDAATTMRARFRARLTLAKVCMQGSQFALGRALFEGLDKDVVARGLDEWEPALAAEVLEGIVICNRALAKGGKPLPPDTALLYDRLCRVDPSAAARIG